MTRRQRDLFEERAAIMEHEGGLTRHEAERLALEEICPSLPFASRNGWSTRKALRLEERKTND